MKSKNLIQEQDQCKVLLSPTSGLWNLYSMKYYWFGSSLGGNFQNCWIVIIIFFGFLPTFRFWIREGIKFSNPWKIDTQAHILASSDPFVAGPFKLCVIVCVCVCVRVCVCVVVVVVVVVGGGGLHNN